jgi:hypothetical protein
MRNAATRGAFEVKGLPANATAIVLGESRRIKIENGRFDDDFRPHDVHLYAISPGQTEHSREQP